MNRLRLQLLAILALAMLLPLLPAAFAARELFRRSLDPLLGDAITGGAQAGLDVTREALEARRERWLAALRGGAAFDTLAPAEVARLRLPDGPDPGAAAGVGLEILSGPEIRVDDVNAGLVARVRGAGGAPVWAHERFPDSLARRAAAVDRGLRLLQALRREQPALLRGFLATFVAVYATLLVLVLAAGLALTSRLTRPLAALARGIDRVAAGDLATRVAEPGGGDVAGLIRHFNAMAGRLEDQQAELARLERLAAWRQMARFLAHEIKNPLTPIQLAAQQVREAYRGDDAAYRRLVDESTGIIEEEVQGLRDWVSEFSQFARLPEPQRAPLAPADLAADLMPLYGPERLAVTAEHADEPWLHADRDQLKRVLVNLVDNALAAQAGIGRSEPVALALARTRDGGAEIRVSDHGPGIAPDQRRRVFEPDFTTKSDGMGLGLAIVERIVHQHGGGIAIVDGAAGATFAITLPGPEPHTGGAT